MLYELCGFYITKLIMSYYYTKKICARLMTKQHNINIKEIKLCQCFPSIPQTGWASWSELGKEA